MRIISRREAIRQTGAAAAALSAGATVAQAQGTGDWPNKPVRIVVNYGPGGGSDNATRPFAERLSRSLGQQVIIENKGGASGAIGTESVIKSAPDGYTFLATPSLTVVILPHLRKLSFDPLKDMIPVTTFAEGTLLITTSWLPTPGRTPASSAGAPRASALTGISSANRSSSTPAPTSCTCPTARPVTSCRISCPASCRSMPIP